MEVCGCTIEIYPKLDRALLEADRVEGEATASSIMSKLLWMLEIAGYIELVEADTASLNTTEVSYYDLFAFLFAKNLLSELQRGVFHTYRVMQDDSPSIRGRIDLLHQCTRNWSRMDFHRCRWDDFTPDTPMNRLFKCACTHLQPRVRNPEPARLLACCAALLDDVSDIDPPSALRDVRFRWDRSNDRFRSSFDMARRLLSGAVYEMASGTDDVFVFLLDMNHVFESFVSAVVSARFGVPVLEQQPIGHLLWHGGQHLIQQIPDMQWNAAGEQWIGDAKYKRLRSVEVFDTTADSSRLGAGDVRQLTCYAGLVARESRLPRLAIFYPSVGEGDAKVAQYKGWNDTHLFLVPVCVDKKQEAAQYIPAGEWMAAQDEISQR